MHGKLSPLHGSRAQRQLQQQRNHRRRQLLRRYLKAFFFTKCHLVAFLQCFDTLLFGRHEGHLACKSWVLVCRWWRFDGNYARLIILQLSAAASVILSSSKIQNGYVLLPANPGPPVKKWPPKWRQGVSYLVALLAHCVGASFTYARYTNRQLLTYLLRRWL